MEGKNMLYDGCLKIGWKTVKLGDFIDFVGGGTPDKKNSDYWNGDIKWASVKDVKNKYLYKTQDSITELGLKSSSSQLAKVGELILVTRISPGRCVIVKDDIAINQDLKIIRLKADVSTNFIYYFFTAKENEFIKRSSGTTVKGIRLEEVRVIEIDLPPLLEQRSIVSKIEQLFSELDNGIANLKLAQEQLKVYRQAVLKKAFEGELTRKWREQQTDLPDTRNLMEQIQTEWEEATKASEKKMKPVKNLTETELAELSGLPEGWSWTKLGQIVWSVKDGPHYSPKYEENGVPFISGGNVRPFGVDFSNTKYISQELHEELSKRCKPELNDILYTKGGTTGIARVNTYDFDFNVWVHVAVLKTIKSIYPFYLQHALNSFHCYRQSQKYTHGVGNQDLGLTRMILITLPICSFSEQQAIVQEIETRLSVCDKIEQDIEMNLERVEALRQSILKKAFEGKLLNERELAEVRRAEDWEPAEVLLERIKAEKAGYKKKLENW
jgi:type I restriction enzyme, S subunit